MVKPAAAADSWAEGAPLGPEMGGLGTSISSIHPKPEATLNVSSH